LNETIYLCSAFFLLVFSFLFFFLVISRSEILEEKKVAQSVCEITLRRKKEQS